jgi:hypothetical protein
MEKSMAASARVEWLCTGCAFPKPDATRVNVTIQEVQPDNTPLNFVSGSGLGIARKEFLLSFGEAIIRQNLWLGDVFDPDGRLLENWSTFVGRRKIIVRGSKNAGVRRCSACGRVVYFAMGAPYLFPRPAEGVAILDAGNGGLVVTESLVESLDLNKWRKLDCVKLPVLNRPKDGLGNLETDLMTT